VGWWGTGGAPTQAVYAPTQVGGVLAQILAADDIVPGDEPSYQLCKLVYLV
jgi:hypothetical protein